MELTREKAFDQLRKNPELAAKGSSNELSRINIGPKRNAAKVAYHDYITKKLFAPEIGAKGLANKLSRININDET
ncbi:hypothetical protein Bca4012_015291 [Brassica carinata]|uniref:Uncharacterized protein n=1 Tax=Brassica carinata TaxID=52824 RepID=A0A8X7Q7D5_BRACI|nr:hypothetical protein Bca52824_070122 [Brassica carinata]